MSDVEETIKRIQHHQGVTGVLVINDSGQPIKSTMDNSTSVQYANNLSNLTQMAKSLVRDLNPQDDLCFLRIRTKKNEIMIAPDKDYKLVVVQSPTSN